ncbi:PREDICTED: uncharacterized protein LOC108775544 isoform X1 [Cyphomyrmex costatus]|uniref:uncharacterized protein LOC108775544 isoform X1 n=1 Tax=Cyphomyrmex costatus TaxID=456900 RepID=UPI00085225F1|nr:PREDICTED: uncharacterized protein LOC108775544 isoform X1 [Cyphomyrmex costatus]XP_018397449.1 PREDICTED: uncharacterized protein LOC108775544 isoform X1 [Cyphomyrmex costatus]
MNRENEEQRPVSQTLCGALQKEPNCKCLVLTVLIYGCLAAITWCRCANVTKIMVNYTKFPIKSTRHVSSPCDDGYIYIPVAFMGMLYLVYLVECYHSPIRIDLLHAESQDSVLSKLVQLKMAQPRIWWKAVSYHYVRRKRQITRYRNGDNYITTQIYYERVNTHSATTHYYYDYCGVKDISKELVLEAKIPITKITLTKGFAFSNIRSATEFEEARSRFFAEQELNDDYMEMREGLDLGYNVSTMLVAVLGNPWFTNHYIYWSLSALLLSWPLRVIIEYKTQYADYQVTKLFGVNYDTPTSGEPIHASISQLSQPGSYMLAPSYSEALLMEPATTRNESEQRQENWQNREEMNVATDIVPSYSEALLYECAEQYDNRNTTMNNAYAGCTNSTILRSADDPMQILPLMPCECHCPCPCHGNANEYEMKMNERSYIEIATSRDHLPTSTQIGDTFENELATLRTTADGRLHPPANPVASSNNLQIEASPSRCSNCGRISASTQTINADTFPRIVARKKSNESSQTTSADFIPNMISEREHRTILRDISEPNLRLQSELANTYPKENVRSLENILENEEDLPGAGKASCVNVEMILLHERQYPERQRRFPVSPSLTHHRSLSLDETTVSPKNLSTIPKTEPRSRIMVNPILNEACWKLPNSKTYYCLKSILKQNKRRYTLVTADEFQNFTEQDVNRGVDYLNSSGRGEKGNNDVRIDKLVDHSHSREKLNPIRRRMPSFEEFRSERDKMYINDQKQESTSPIQEVFPGDPFGGKDIVPVRNLRECSVREGDSANDSAMLIRPNRSLTVQDARSLPIDCSTMNLLRPDSITYSLPHITHSSWNNGHERKLQYLLHNRYPFEAMGTSAKVEETSRGHRNDVSFLSYNRLHSERTNRWSTSSNEYDDRSREGHPKYLSNRRRQAAGLTRSLTERRPKVARLNRNFRRSFTGRMEDYRMENAKRTNFSIETSL